jgi:hypothetical protein
MRKIKEIFSRMIKSIEETQMARAERILANHKHGLRRWE